MSFNFFVKSNIVFSETTCHQCFLHMRKEVVIAEVALQIASALCIDGKHHYSTRPENHNESVLVGIRAHFIDILNEDGSVLVRHRRQYGKKRTDTVDYSTSLAVLSKNAGAWMNSGVRLGLPDALREYLDKQES